MSIKQSRHERMATRSPLSSAALTLELLHVLSELRRRTSVLREFRNKGFDDPRFAEVTIELRRELATPILDGALSGEFIRAPAAAVPYCMEAHRRIRRIAAPRRSWERLLHDEVLILLASVSVQRAVNRLLELEE
jgi:hypothetical protein